MIAAGVLYEPDATSDVAGVLMVNFRDADIIAAALKVGSVGVA